MITVSTVNNCDYLGLDSKTLMVVQVSPVRSSASETLSSLTFAQRINDVELGQAHAVTLH